MNAPLTVTVPLFDGTTEPPPPARLRALKRHLVRSLRDLRVARRPERLLQQATPEPTSFVAAVLTAGCATCRGHCCKGGGDHAYLDERTMARVRRDHPEDDARAIIRLYLDRVAPRSFAGSCLFHGPDGCTLGRELRSELCNSYYCDGLQAFLKDADATESVKIVASRNGSQQCSPVLTRDGTSH